MSASAILAGSRVRLRRWRDEDRHAFAAMNSDARVMEFFRSSLSRADSERWPIASDALIAATALAHGLTMVIRNTAHFATAGVALLNPWDQSVD
jgi:predicted nucleic acid-binding protein